MHTLRYIVKNWSIGLKVLFARPASTIAGGIAIAAGAILQVLFCFALIMAPENSAGNNIGTELFLYLGFWQIANSLYGIFFAWAHDRMSEVILDGGLDFMLLRPLNTFVSLSFAELDVSSMFSLPVGLVLVIYSVKTLGITLPFLAVMHIVLYVIIAAMLIFLLLNAAALTSIFSEGLADVMDIAVSWTEFGSRPAKKYKKPVSTVINGIIPLAAALNLPALFVEQGSLHFADIFAVLICLGVFIVLNLILWKLGFKRYNSASS